MADVGGSSEEDRLRHIRALHRRLLSVAQDERDWAQVRASGVGLTRELCAEVENFCVVLMQELTGSDSVPLARPRGSGVLVFSRYAACDGYGILTAAHVLDELRSGDGSGRIQAVTPSAFHRDQGLRPLTLARSVATYLVRVGPQPGDGSVPPDLAWVGLAMEDVRRIEGHGGVFFDLDRERYRIPGEPQRDCGSSDAPARTGVAVVVGTLGHNYRTGEGPDPVGERVPFNLLHSMCGDCDVHTRVAGAPESFDLKVVHSTDVYGSAGDPVVGGMAPTTWKGMSGCGYWHVVFGGPGDPVPLEVRLEGIVFAQLETQSDGSRRLRANSRALVDWLIGEGRRRHAQSVAVG